MFVCYNYHLRDQLEPLDGTYSMILLDFMPRKSKDIGTKNAPLFASIPYCNYHFWGINWAFFVTSHKQDGDETKPAHHMKSWLVDRVSQSLASDHNPYSTKQYDPQYYPDSLV